jgi:hypothetical protein
LRSWGDLNSLQLFFNSRLGSSINSDRFHASLKRLIYKGMHIPITIAALAVMTVAIFLLRIFWMRVPPRLRFFLIRGSVALIVIHVFFVVTKWGTSAPRVNVTINWLAVAGYELLVMLFSRVSPRWLTTVCAFILIVPLFASSVLFPLTMIFHPGVARRVPIGNQLSYRVVAWNSGGGSESGVDVDILYSPPFVPFLTHKVQTQAFSTGECNAYAAYAVPGPTPRTVIARCPYWPNQSAGTEDKLLQLH